MTNKEIIEAVEMWQANNEMHPLTCGYSSEHSPLIVRDIEGHIILSCLDCLYAQETIPKVVIKHYIHMKEAA